MADEYSVNSGNTQVASTNSSTHAAEGFLNAAADQALGKSAISKQMYDDVIHEASDWTQGQKEQFLGQLSCQYVDPMYTDAAWTDKYGDIFFQNSDEFGAIVQIINTEMPKVRENRAWDAITSGVTTIGSNTVYLPVVKEQLTGGTSSWAIPFALTGTQMNTAFKDASGLRRFESYVRLSAENSAKYHLARMSAANRNNYIVEKIHKGNSAGKVNVVNLVAEYCNMFGVDSMTKEEFLANKDGCLRQVNRILKKYKALLTDMTTLFSMDPNTEGKFIPSDRFTFSILSDFASNIESELYSTTYHDNFVKLPGYREVPSWQALRGSAEASNCQFDYLSGIQVGRQSSVIDDTITSENQLEVVVNGVVGLMVDKWAIMHTIVRHRMGVQRDDIKDITLFEHQYTDRYINNLMLNGLVFTVADVGV